MANEIEFKNLNKFDITKTVQVFVYKNNAEVNITDYKDPRKNVHLYFTNHLYCDIYTTQKDYMHCVVIDFYSLKNKVIIITEKRERVELNLLDIIDNHNSSLMTFDEERYFSDVKELKEKLSMDDAKYIELLYVYKKDRKKPQCYISYKGE